MKGLKKDQDLWNIALFVLSEKEPLFDCVTRKPDKRFSPQSLIRTRYHQITGYADPFLFANEKDDKICQNQQEPDLLQVLRGACM